MAPIVMRKRTEGSQHPNGQPLLKQACVSQWRSINKNADMPGSYFENGWLHQIA
jgi:hypothetical protein